jgi:hypothetical protein
MARKKDSVEHKTDKLVKLAVDAINKHGIVFVKYIIPHLPITRITFYARGLDKNEEIKEALYNQKIAKKQHIVDDWAKSDNFAKQKHFMLLAGDKDERERLHGKDSDDEKKELTINLKPIEWVIPKDENQS